MKIIVQKFGGSSVKNRDLLFRVAEIVKSYKDKNYAVVVVVSAQGDTTDKLIEKAYEVSETPPLRELDMLMATGELASASLLAMTLDTLGMASVALSGIQAGIKTDNTYREGRILSIDTSNIMSYLEEGKVVVVSGFQGVGRRGEYVTLGRGGSDTSATAIAAALKADRCQIYTDVEGIFTADPRKIPTARHLAKVSYNNMFLIARMGAKVLHAPSVEFAKKANLPLEILSTFNPTIDTLITADTGPMPISGLTSQKGYYRTEVPLKIPANPLELEDIVTPPTCFEISRREEGNWFILYTEGKPHKDMIRRLSELSHLPHRVVTEEVVRISVIGDELPYNNHLIWDILEVKNSIHASRVFTSRGCCWLFTDVELADMMLGALHKNLIEQPPLDHPDIIEE